MADSQSSNLLPVKPRSSSISQASENSQTAAEFIKEQLSLEAEAREALPYQFDTCTRDLGAIRQSLFSCLTCNPPPASLSDPYAPAGVCYSCSISCHGEHTLVELFNKRNFVCDCGTTRLPGTSPCTLRLNANTGHKGDVTGQEPAEGNRYNHNFRNQFCGCGEEYDPHQEKGTMFQCLGLGTVEEGGCGEDWWHPECIVGLSREDFKKSVQESKPEDNEQNPEKSIRGIQKEVSFSRSEEDANGYPEAARRPSIVTAIAAGHGLDGNDVAAEAEEDEDEDDPLPPGFPEEDDFDHFICYKCVQAQPWIKRYADTTGFLPPVYFDASLNASTDQADTTASETANGLSKKRKADDDDEEDKSTATHTAPPKRQKSEDPVSALSSIPETKNLPITPKKQDPSVCKYDALPPAPTSPSPFSLFLKPDFRDYLCHCATHFAVLKPLPQLLEEEENYEPPVSEEGIENGGSAGTGSIYDRGEAAFSAMDRVQALQGAQLYANLKSNLKSFLQPFAESGKAVGAEDIKEYFEKLRGDEQAIKEAAAGALGKGDDEDGNGGDGDHRREQSGY